MLKLKGVYPYMLFLIWFVVLGNLFASVIPINVNKSYLSKISVVNFVPQGWGFFTRNPREQQVILYKIDLQAKVKVFTKTNNSSEFYFGLSRKNRLISIETGNIMKLLDTVNHPWIISDEKNTTILSLDTNTSTDTIKTKLKPSSIEGDFFIVKQHRVPWAWSKNYENIIMPYKYKKIYVKPDK